MVFLSYLFWCLVIYQRIFIYVLMNIHVLPDYEGEISSPVLTQKLVHKKSD